MAFTAVCLLAFLAPPAIEVAICDPSRRVCWNPEGVPLKSYVPPAWVGQWGTEGFFTKKPDRRVILVRMPWLRDSVPTVVFQYPNGGRVPVGTVLLSKGVKDSWVAVLELPVNVGKDEGLFEIGVANGVWRTVGTKWPAKKRAKGEPFNVRTSEANWKDSRGTWGITSNLPGNPRHQAWRLLPYGKGGNELQGSGARRRPDRSWEFYFNGNVPRDSVTRIDLQRRPIQWTKYAEFDLGGPK